MSAALGLGCLLLSGCHKTAGGTESTASEAKPAAAANGKTDAKAQSETAGKGEAADKEEGGGKEQGGGKEEASPSVALTPDQVEKLGLATQNAEPTKYTEEASGYGVVVPHDTIAMAAAELVTAQAAERLSQSALARAKRLSGTPGAVSADVEETAVHQAAVDTAALTLTKQKLSSTLGLKPPWKSDEDNPTLRELASGQIKLLRVTFPLGALSGGIPASLRAAHIAAAKADQGWKMNVVWAAPADTTVPGRSFFALLKGSDAGEGERLMVWAPIGETTSGVVVPAAATVLSEGKYWCYVEKKPGTYARTEVDTGIATADGYFVTEGVVAGDKIVVTAAGQLLAKESNSGAESD